MRISIIDDSGKVIFDNTLDSLPGSNHLHRKEIADAVRHGTGYTLRRHSESTGETYFYSARKGEKYIVRAAVPYSVSLQQLLAADFGFLWFMSGITMCMCVIGYFATRRLGIHVSRLNLFAKKAERGERIYDTEPFPHDELGEISNHIVRLYARLQQANADRDREHRAAIHEQQEKERIKKQLTNNINHELKTPVASIQACLETLLSHPDLGREKREDFLMRCMANTTRLRQLLADVALITRMDDGGAAIMKEKLDLACLIADVVDEKRDMAAAKGIVIDNESEACSAEINGNASLLESVFNNLIDNALAYSEAGRITIRLKELPDDILLVTFSDNGCGVGEEHLPRLFERFYRVDKGRSRAAGGTGLGLAIVKNAVMFHGGSVTVENSPKGGLVFRLTFRRK